MTFKEFLLTKPDNIHPDDAHRLYNNYCRANEKDIELTNWFQYSKDSDWLQDTYNPLRQRDNVEDEREQCAQRAAKLIEVGRSLQIFEPRISALNRLQLVPHQQGAFAPNKSLGRVHGGEEQAGEQGSTEQSTTSTTSTEDADGAAKSVSSKRETEIHDKTILTVKNIPSDVPKSTIAAVVRRVEEAALAQLQTNSSNQKMNEYTSIVNSRQLLFATRNNYRNNYRGRRGDTGGSTKFTLIHLKYRPLGTAFFPSIDAVAAAVQQLFVGQRWSQEPGPPTSTGKNSKNSKNSKNEVVVDKHDVEYHRYKNPQRLRHLKAGVLTADRVRHDADKAATLAASLDQEFRVPKEINHARLQAIIAKKKDKRDQQEEEVSGTSSSGASSRTHLQQLEISVTYLLRVHNYAYLNGRRFNSEGQRFEVMGDAGFFWPYTDSDVVEKNVKEEETRVVKKDKDGGNTTATASVDGKTDEEEDSSATNSATEASSTSATTTATTATTATTTTAAAAAIEPALQRDRDVHSRTIDGPRENQMRSCAPAQIKKREELLVKSEKALGVAVNAAVDELVQRNTEQESSKRFRCVLSGKLFSAEEFVRKHILSKHGHLVERAKKEALLSYMFELYMNDPKKLVSPRMDQERIQQRQHRRNHHQQRNNYNNNNNFNNNFNNNQGGRRGRKRGRNNSSSGQFVPSLMGGGGASSNGDGSGFRAFSAGGRSVKKQRMNHGGSGGKKGGPPVSSYANVNSMDDDDVQYERR
jgi:hypothetical protein